MKISIMMLDTFLEELSKLPKEKVTKIVELRQHKLNIENQIVQLHIEANKIQKEISDIWNKDCVMNQIEKDKNI